MEANERDSGTRGCWFLSNSFGVDGQKKHSLVQASVTNRQHHVPAIHVRQPGERLPMAGLEILPEAGYFTPFLLKKLKYSSRVADNISVSLYEVVLSKSLLWVSAHNP